MEPLIRLFIEHLSVERGLSPLTLEAYERDLKRYMSFLKKKGIREVGKINRDHIQQFLYHEKERGLSAVSIYRSLAAMRMFHRFCVAERHSPSDPTERVDSPKTLKSLPAHLSRREVESMLQAPNLRKPIGIRDQACLELMYASGLRASELVTLKAADVNFELGIVRVMGKGQKERIVPFGKSARKSLQRYMARTRALWLERGSGEKTLFLTQQGKRMTRQALWGILKKIVLSRRIYWKGVRI